VGVRERGGVHGCCAWVVAWDRGAQLSGTASLVRPRLHHSLLTLCPQASLVRVRVFGHKVSTHNVGAHLMVRVFGCVCGCVRKAQHS